MNTRQLYTIMFLLMVLWVFLYVSTRPKTIILPVSGSELSPPLVSSYQLNTSRRGDCNFEFGVALSGGGAKGFSHLGVLKALEERNMRPDILAGVSSGALLAALYADGYSTDSILAMYEQLDFLQYLSVDFNEGGLLSLKKFKLYLDGVLRAKTFEELKIPLKVVVTDLDHGTSVVLDKGSLTEALVASCSVPILFDPWVIRGVHYVDGGLFHNLPAFALRDDCRFLMGVSLGPIESDSYEKSLATIALRSYRFVFRSNANYDKSLCDVLVEPQGIGKYDGGDLEDVRPIFDLGYRSALQVLDSLNAVHPKLTKRLGYKK
jgi:NTE family protein